MVDLQYVVKKWPKALQNMSRPNDTSHANQYRYSHAKFASSAASPGVHDHTSTASWLNSPLASLPPIGSAEKENESSALCAKQHRPTGRVAVHPTR